MHTAKEAAAMTIRGRRVPGPAPPFFLRREEGVDVSSVKDPGTCSIEALGSHLESV